MPINAPDQDVEQGDEQEQVSDFVPQGNVQEDNQPSDAGDIEVKLKLEEDQKSEIISYLEDNLPNMQISEDEEKRIKSYLAMYDMAVRKRQFPYENAPSFPSSDIYDKINEWLDKAEVAFLITSGTFTIDREETGLEEQSVRRMEKTWHKKYFWGSGFANELRLILFEAGCLGGSLVSVREVFDVEPVREKVVIKDENDLKEYQLSITKEDYKKAKDSVARGKIFMTERDILKVKSAGSNISRINRTKFLYPQNVTDFKKWQIVSEVEFYDRSDLLMMAENGQLDKAEVDTAISASREKLHYATMDDSKKERENLPSNVLPSSLDVSFQSNVKGLKEYGEGYEEEYALYRVTLKYKVKTNSDPSGLLRSWCEFIYCPAGGNLLSTNFCKYGFPYHLIRYRPVPHQAFGSGIAQARYPFNVLDSDVKSYYMACLEQEIGSPTLIRTNSNLWASGFRTYPGSVGYTDDPERDVKSFQMPEKSRLAVEGMKVILGSSPDSNRGAGYNSGKREQILQEQRNVADQSRMHAIAVDLDAPVNMAWKIDCHVSKLNTENKKWIDWVYKDAPKNTKLYILESEMDPEIVWTSVLSAISMSPDAAFQRAIQLKELFHDSVPVSVNNPRLISAWLNFVANYVSEMDDKNRSELLPNTQDFAMYQNQLGQMGGQREGQPSTPLNNQSSNTPFHRPPAQGQRNPQKQTQNGNGAFSPNAPLPAGSGGFNPRMPTP